ncbi:MAG: hypothetical protein PUI48_05885 [Oscillospiraceae bacterium]|nr:hypothetical protein [Oscillospiraceae bacterium]MDY3791872.1 hypothetical protein [Oscillospiraceae bacterium]MDY6208328.1 hypothetical protein [Oscillospiraceae bacterium]
MTVLPGAGFYAIPCGNGLRDTPSAAYCRQAISKQPYSDDLNARFGLRPAQYDRTLNERKDH